VTFVSIVSNKISGDSGFNIPSLWSAMTGDVLCCDVRLDVSSKTFVSCELVVAGCGLVAPSGILWRMVFAVLYGVVTNTAALFQLAGLCVER
jgi:hypothetical protein